jgi:hypothetical protein
VTNELVVGLPVGALVATVGLLVAGVGALVTKGIARARPCRTTFMLGALTQYSAAPSQYSTELWYEAGL